MRNVTTIIIGAGQSGLAMSRELSHRGVDHLVLEKGVVGEAWRSKRWDSLRLLTPNWANGLPGTPYGGPDPDGFMAISELAANLDSLAAAIKAPVRTETTVYRVGATARGYAVETNHGVFSCETVVLACGACAQPKVPMIAVAVPTSVVQINPCIYKRPDDLPAGGVLVVGASATGVQLARELQSGRTQRDDPFGRWPSAAAPILPRSRYRMVVGDHRRSRRRLRQR